MQTSPGSTVYCRLSYNWVWLLPCPWDLLWGEQCRVCYFQRKVLFFFFFECYRRIHSVLMSLFMQGLGEADMTSKSSTWFSSWGKLKRSLQSLMTGPLGNMCPSGSKIAPVYLWSQRAREGHAAKIARRLNHLSSTMGCANFFSMYSSNTLKRSQCSSFSFPPLLLSWTDSLLGYPCPR